jgi:hypothetical protein
MTPDGCKVVSLTEPNRAVLLRRTGHADGGQGGGGQGGGGQGGGGLAR